MRTVQDTRSDTQLKNLHRQLQHLHRQLGEAKASEQQAWDEYRELWAATVKLWQEFCARKRAEILPEQELEVERERLEYVRKIDAQGRSDGYKSDWEVYSSRWEGHWITIGQRWRTQPEICLERQEQLKNWLNDKRLQYPPYPFQDKILHRAEVEWLLARHREGMLEKEGDWLRDQIMHRVGTGEPKRGLDLRGAWLRDYDESQPVQNGRRDGPADLSKLPLAELRGGLSSDGWERDQPAREAAAIHLEGADLHHTCLKGAGLRSAHIEGANLEFADLDGASLRGAHLRDHTLYYQLLHNQAPKDEDRAWQYNRAKGANLRFAFVDNVTSLRDVCLDDCRSVADVRWDAVDLANVKWTMTLKYACLGDERDARDPLRRNDQGQLIQDAAGKPVRKTHQERLVEYERAVRANRQLARAFEAQGMNDWASHFAYRAQKCRQHVLWFRIRGGNPELQEELNSEVATSSAYKDERQRWFVHQELPPWHQWLLESHRREREQASGGREIIQPAPAQPDKLGAEPARRRSHTRLLDFEHRAQDGAEWLGSWFLWLGGFGQKFPRLVIVYLLTLLSFAGIYLWAQPDSLSIHATSTNTFSVIDAILTSIAAFHGRPFFMMGWLLDNTGLHHAAAMPGDYLALFEALFGLTLEGMAIAMLGQRFLGKSGG